MCTSPAFPWGRPLGQSGGEGGYKKGKVIFIIFPGGRGVVRGKDTFQRHSPVIPSYNLTRPTNLEASPTQR